MKIRVGSDGMHCLVTITGIAEQDILEEPILLFKALTGSPDKIRLDGIHWMIQEKMGFNLYWIMSDESLEIVMPLESRGSIDLEKVLSQSSPEGSVGMAISSFKRTESKMSFFILLDLVKR